MTVVQQDRNQITEIRRRVQNTEPFSVIFIITEIKQENETAIIAGKLRKGKINPVTAKGQLDDTERI